MTRNMDDLIYEHLRNISYMNRNIANTTTLLRDYINIENQPRNSIHRERYVPLNIRQPRYNNYNNNNNINNSNDNNNNNSNRLHRNNVSRYDNVNDGRSNTTNTNNQTDRDTSLNEIISNFPNIYTDVLNNALNNGTNIRTSSGENNRYVVSFDTYVPNALSLFQSLLNRNVDQSNIEQSEVYTYNIEQLNENNITNLRELCENHEILDIERYDLIENPVNDICPITRERINNNQNVMMICKCKHIFHKSSLMRWIRNHNTCPSCRLVIQQ